MKQKRIRKKHRIKIRKPLTRHTLFGSSLFFFVLFLGVGYFFVFNSFFQVGEVSVIGSESVDEDALERFIERRVGKSLFFIKSESIFLFSTREIEENVLNEAPFVGDIRIERVFPNKLEVRTKERKPIAFWCKRKDKKRCFFLDKKGVAFERTERLSTERPIIVKENDLGEDNVVMEKRELSLIFMVFDQLSRNDFPANFFHIEKGGEVVVYTKEGVELYFLLEHSQRALDNLEIILEEKLTREEVGALEYIDLRFGDRIYYK